MVTVDLFMIALDPSDVKHFTPIVKRLAQLWRREADIIAGKRPFGTLDENGPFYDEDEELHLKLYDLGIKYAKHTVILEDYDVREATAFHDVISAIEEINPEAEDMFFTLGSTLVTASDVKKYYPLQEKLLASLKLDKIIAEDTEFGRDIDASSYKSALAKYRKILKYCAEHGYALLNVAL